MSQTSALLDAEKAALEAELASTTSPPSNYSKVVIGKTLDWIARMRQIVGETTEDYRLRINMLAQQAPPGKWSTSFFSQLESSIASDHADPVRGGNGRSTT